MKAKRWIVQPVLDKLFNLRKNVSLTYEQDINIIGETTQIIVTSEELPKEMLENILNVAVIREDESKQ